MQDRDEIWRFETEMAGGDARQRWEMDVGDTVGESDGRQKWETEMEEKDVRQRCDTKM